MSQFQLKKLNNKTRTFWRQFVFACNQGNLKFVTFRRSAQSISRSQVVAPFVGLYVLGPKNFLHHINCLPTFFKTLLTFLTIFFWQKNCFINKNLVHKDFFCRTTNSTKKLFHKQKLFFFY